jgi:hypothetical protein
VSAIAGDDGAEYGWFNGGAGSRDIREDYRTDAKGYASSHMEGEALWSDKNS